MVWWLWPFSILMGCTIVFGTLYVTDMILCKKDVMLRNNKNVAMPVDRMDVDYRNALNQLNGVSDAQINKLIKWRMQTSFFRWGLMRHFSCLINI